MKELFSILIFPGFLFVVVLSFAAEAFDRILHARLQNRIGPPWFQPLADFIKLIAKEDIIPSAANAGMFRMAPVVALASTVTAFLYIPLCNAGALFSFNGDVIVVLYLLTIPTMAIFIGGWYSTSLFARLGSVRALTQLFAYEVPLFIGILSSALLADSWSLKAIASFYNTHPLLLLCNIPGFAVSLIALMGKLERVPFDIPEAETEIVAGSFTEYSGRLLALFRMTLNIEMVVGASLLAAVFMPLGPGNCVFSRFILYLVKVFFVVGLISLLRTLFARLRLDQMVTFCWKFLAPLGIAQLLLNLIVKGFVIR
jgi:NADH-quinone oxidoreductase subunit H